MAQFEVLRPTANEVHYLNLIAFTYFGGIEHRPLQHDQVVFDRDPPRIDVEVAEEPRNRPRPSQFEGIAVQNDLQGRTSRSPSTKLPTGRSDCSFTGNLRASVVIQTSLLLAAG